MQKNNLGRLDGDKRDNSRINIERIKKVMSTIFKKIIDKEIPANIVYEDDDFLAFYDIQPQAKVHVIVIPKKEIKNLDEATEEDVLVLGKLQLTIAKIARKLGISKDGYRVITNINENGGQTVFHMHYHILGGEKLPENFKDRKSVV